MRQTHWASIELTLDAASDAAVRGDGKTLPHAGLLNRGTHLGASNAPHLTLAAGEGIRTTAELSGTRGLRIVAGHVPLRLELAGFAVFAARPGGLLLAHHVVPTMQLLAVHGLVHAAIRERAPGIDLALSRPDRWSALITLGVGSRRSSSAGPSS